MKINKFILFIMALATFVSISAQTPSADSIATKTDSVEQKKLKQLVETFADRFEFHGYAQAGYTYRDAEPTTTNTFDIKRVLFWAKVKVTDRWSFLFMHDFSSVVQEFYTDYRVHEAFNVRFGQFKNSYSLENPLSPTKLELIECYSQAVLFLSGCGTDPLYGVQYGRDLGLMFYGTCLDNHFYYELALMNGQGINRKDGNKQKDIIARLDYRPIEGLRFVATAQRGEGHAIDSSAYNPEIKKGDNYRRDRLSIGAEYINPKFRVRTEYLSGKDGKVNLWGYYCTVGLPLYKKLEAIASFDYFERNVSKDMDQTNYTAGLQYWFFNKCRAQVQYTRCCPFNIKDYNHVQVQMQVAF